MDGTSQTAPDDRAGPATEAFLAHRNLLFTVAYEMLGSTADAEDALQETWLRWAGALILRLNGEIDTLLAVRIDGGRTGYRRRPEARGCTPTAAGPSRPRG